MPTGLEGANARLAGLLRTNLTPQPNAAYFRGLLGIAPQQPQVTLRDAVETGAGFLPAVGEAMSWDAMKQNYDAGNYGRAALAGLGLIGLPVATLGGLMKIASSDAPGMLGSGGGRLAGLLRNAYPDQAGMIGYHGTPHTLPPTRKNPLGEFKLSAVGSGEGAQMYGHGVYIAENPAVGTGYAEKLSKPNVQFFKTPETPAEMQVADAVRRATEAVQHDYRATAARQSWLRLSDPSMDEINGNAFLRRPPATPERRAQILALRDAAKALGEPSIPPAGSLYHVDLPDKHVETMLDWDAPLKDQPQAVQSALRALGVNLDQGATGEQAYKALASAVKGGQAGASRALNAAGVKGIRYFDGDSRAAKQGTRNFVVFDPKILKILKRE